MNVFVLCTGRCGSVTFAKACSHLTNFTVAHESRCRELGDSRLDFPENHIEVDNRLSWFLGRLDQKYGDNAVYVHLVRNSDEVAESLNNRWTNPLGIAAAYAKGILMTRNYGLHITNDLVRTVNENIELFLKDKTQKFTINIESPNSEFKRFWDFILGEGDVDSAINELSVKNNINSFAFKDNDNNRNLDDENGFEKIIKQFEEKEKENHYLKEALKAKIKNSDNEIKILKKEFDSYKLTSHIQSSKLGKKFSVRSLLKKLNNKA